MSEITKILEPSTGWTRHTVLTLLKLMQEKGSIQVHESGPVKMYSPLIGREEASAGQTKKLLSHVFAGKASLLINHLWPSPYETNENTDRSIGNFVQHVSDEVKYFIAAKASNSVR